MAAAAIVLALVAGIGVYMYASGADKRAQENASLVDAFVANADIAKGTTGEELVQAGLITQEKVAKGSVPPGMISSPDDLAGLQAAGPISTKQFITRGMFSKEGESGGVFANNLESDRVAVTVTVDADRGVANQITPGDHVDIAVPTQNPDTSEVTYDYMLSNVKVLAVGANTTAQAPAPTDGESADAAASPAPQNSGVLTFEVSKADALRIISANSGSSKIYLVLLPPTTVAAGK
jgi:pilus assembly protein CpaB